MARPAPRLRLLPTPDARPALGEARPAPGLAPGAALPALSPPRVEASSAPLDCDALFRQHARYLGAIALRILGNDAEVDDVIQEVFLIAMRGVDRIRSPEAARAWLATIAVRRASRRLRVRRLRHLLGFHRAVDAEQLPAPGASGEARALLVRVYAALEDLPVAQRVAWTLRHVEGEALDEVARLCECSLATAKRRIAAAHEALERILADD